MGGTPATSRHTSHTLRLLPSGPDRVHELLLREDQSPIILLSRACLKRWGDYSVSARIMQGQKLLNSPFSDRLNKTRSMASSHDAKYRRFATTPYYQPYQSLMTKRTLTVRLLHRYFSECNPSSRRCLISRSKRQTLVSEHLSRGLRPMQQSLRLAVSSIAACSSV